jgi:hypothetical protein
MPTSRSPLAKAFLEDHRKMTRQMARLRDALRRDDLTAAVRLADELDQVAGPHIEFEETIYYPVLIEPLGKTFVKQLYREHDQGLKAVKALTRRKPNGKPFSPSERQRLLEQVQTALEHAGTCGTLVSYLASVDEKQQSTLLEQLEKTRSQQRRWTEWASRRVGE